MQHYLRKLDNEERELLYDALPLITVLVASADGEIDLNEATWAEKITHIRSYTHHQDLRAYYKAVDDRFQERLDHYINATSNDPQKRIEYVSKKLEQLNPILRKLELDFADLLYEDFRSFAKHVAKSSGGFLSMGSISPNEHKLIRLDMIKPLM